MIKLNNRNLVDPAELSVVVTQGLTYLGVVTFQTDCRVALTKCFHHHSRMSDVSSLIKDYMPVAAKSNLMTITLSATTQYSARLLSEEEQLFFHQQAEVFNRAYASALDNLILREYYHSDDIEAKVTSRG